jgi:hypothetical protein
MNDGGGSPQGNQMDGKIDDIRIYPYALSQEKVKIVMNSGSVSVG